MKTSLFMLLAAVGLACAYGQDPTLADFTVYKGMDISGMDAECITDNGPKPCPKICGDLPTIVKKCNENTAKASGRYSSSTTYFTYRCTTFTYDEKTKCAYFKWRNAPRTARTGWTVYALTNTMPPKRFDVSGYQVANSWDAPQDDTSCTGSNGGVCKICGSPSKVAEACNKLPNCVAFTYEFDYEVVDSKKACGYLKYATKQGQMREGWYTYFKEPKPALATPKTATSGRKLSTLAV